MFYSDNDEIVPPAASQALAADLDAEQIVIPGGGHFPADDGFTKLPEALEAVEKIARAPRLTCRPLTRRGVSPSSTTGRRS
ncbi:alpha/beta hydrolase [Nocardia transvalensis]|uniref:alpha/beta hydrolase n=1 Tax=Nocardia transvalensis TaxID=37333 RepID=UPI0018960F8B|nr:alpha/beta hydrolase [Nocardia transvalensis]MBF6329678.1 alpha/beta hydrolase [Nocardia transvalensis]